MSAPGVVLTPSELLARIPQQEPFRFIDEIVSVDDERIEARYRWRPESDFYRGHFPGNPVTPGVLLVESMAQAGVVALGLYLACKELGPEAAEKLVTVFTDANVEFSGLVRPGERVAITGTKVFFRRRKLRSQVEMKLADGTLVCSGTLSGMGVTR
jgi:3-hydroxyacyl-[acyl-carrier-protein] dehydratase